MRRTLAAAALTAGALTVPLAAWYVAGSREAGREASEAREAPRRQAREEARRLAERLGGRLEALREAEDRRPFYHYQNLYHDPKGAYEGAAVIPSPLAEGPQDPWIKAYFQVGADDRVTLPTLNDELPEVDALPAQQALLEEIRPAALSCRASSVQDDLPQQEGQRYQTLDNDAWSQNLGANRIFTDIQKQKQEGKEARAQQRAAKGDVAIRLGAFRWCSVPMGKGKATGLLAAREVGTPAGTLTQGFAISEPAVAEWLRQAAFPARLLPGAPGGWTEAALSLPGAAWKVSLDAAPALSGADGKARRIRGAFRRRFLGGAAAAGLAGLCVVALVWQAERLALQRSQFAASAAHELRTPLAGLRMYGEMLAEGLGDPARGTDYARRIAVEAERLGRVVANVLGFTRLERGTLSVHPEPGDLGAAVREAAARQAPALAASGARLTVDIPEGLPPARFDRDALAQILQNLLDNAEKYGRSGADRGIRISLEAAGDCILLSVADRGPGIPAALRARLFRPFSRGKDADAPAGLGLGLALARALAEAQGASIACEAAPGGGARFTVRFPTFTAL